MEWYKERFVNRRDYILDHLADLSLNCEETLLVLLIDFYNEHKMPISPQVLATQMHKDPKVVDQLLTSLMNKGYLETLMENHQMVLSIEGVFKSSEVMKSLDGSLIDLFEDAFNRLLSPNELQRLANIQSTYEDKLIRYALREALTYQRCSMDYIERVLMKWKEKNFTANDYEEGRRL